MNFDLVTYELGELGSLKNGANFNKNDAGDGCPVMSVKQLFRGRFVDTEGLGSIKLGTLKKLDDYLVKKNDLLFARSSLKAEGSGQVAIVNEYPQNCIFSGFTIRFRVFDESKVNPLYLYYLLRSPKYREIFVRITTGSVISNLTQATLSKIPVELPNKETQDYVANIFDELDRKRELGAATNQTLEQLAQAIFKSWFVDFDPVKAKMNGEQPEGMDAATASLFPEKLVESELGLIPEGWEVGALSSVVDVIMGQSPKGSTYNDQNEGTPLVNGPVEFGVYHPVAQKWTTAPTKMSKNKDLIVCVRGSTTGRYVVSDGEYCLGRGVCSIRSNDFPSFANYLFKSELNSLLHLTTGSTFPSWSGPTLKNFKVVVPPETIIEKFELLIGKLCEMMARNTEQNETLSTLRDTLLPKLLSGEIELGQAQELAEVE
ncbi:MULTISPECIES: restriction endonuclease subunit S [Vibrio harveyi group]|uniref:restriction endonuclease subunit S n=1 Tax=Vibrio harveyi group TaxID=717610 RepID=UPI00215B8A52|nr:MULTISPECIES: restriction endonuclease subunit S [Vibrio harveyi group]MCR9488316.1 restriction endonuclease subunit S [Vibrio alginolyticus]MCR9547370.1 restriction endonuclease subunit S [Vibrio antiquarius]MCR9572858.1 restriction endonuclease subunit S [Vibrio alginolyticus]